MESPLTAILNKAGKNETLTHDELKQVLDLVILLSEDAARRTFRLTYKYGGVPPQHKQFKMHGTLRNAIERGQKHCLAMGYKFIHVEPYIVDLDEQEKLKLSGKEGIAEELDLRSEIGARR